MGVNYIVAGGKGAALLALVVWGLFVAPVWGDEQFPLRSRYPTVKLVDLAQLQAMRPNVIIVDARSSYEFETLHIKGALNVDLGSPGFIEAIKALRAESPHPIVFYCNGHGCMRSYQATLEAQNAGVSDVSAYDAGIFEWVKANPADSVLLGRSPADPASLIPDSKLQAHILDAAEFEKRIDDSVIILDVRAAFQKDATSLFPTRQRTVPLDFKALKPYLDQARRERKTLLIYDDAGEQIRSLQYYIEAEKVDSYYFLAGGAKGYYKYMMKDIVGGSSNKK